MASDGLDFVRKIYCVNQFRAQYGKLFVSSLFVCANITETDFRTEKYVEKIIWCKCDHRGKNPESKSIKSCWHKSSGRFVSSSDYYKSSLVHSNSSHRIAHEQKYVFIESASMSMSVCIAESNTLKLDKECCPLCTNDASCHLARTSRCNRNETSTDFLTAFYCRLTVSLTQSAQSISHIWT